MDAIFMLRNFLSRGRYSPVVFAATLILGLTASVVLAAQQVEADNPHPDVLVDSTAAPASQDANDHAPAAPAQSAPGSDAAAQTNSNSQSQTDGQRQQQTKRILGIVPNFRAVSTDKKLPPQSVKEKFVTATEDSFDYSSIFIPALLAGYDLGIRATPEFHEGAAGYARYLWHSGVDQTSENYMVEFFVPALTHEDTRFYTLGRGGFLKRAGYALSRAVVTRTDLGKETFNFSEVVGAGAASGLSNLYYPSATRSLSNTGTQWGEDIAIDAAAFCVKEFWPDVNHRLFHNKDAATTVQK
jgi:hypothetical protein